MKKILVYTESEHDTCKNFLSFLSRLAVELDNAKELTTGREDIIDKTQFLITDIMNFFPVDEGE